MSQKCLQKLKANLLLLLICFWLSGSAVTQIEINLARATINDVHLCELELGDITSLLGEPTITTNRKSILVNEYTPTHANYANEGMSFIFRPPYIDDEQNLLTLTIFLTNKNMNSINKISAFSGRLLPKVNLSWGILETRHWLESNFSGGEISITSPEKMRELYASLPKWYHILYLRNQVYYYGVGQTFDDYHLTLGHSEQDKALEIIAISCE